MRGLGRMAAVLATGLLLAVQVPAAAGNPPGAPASYLVGLKAGTQVQGLPVPGIQVTAHWPHLNAVAVRATPAGLAGLRANPGVAYVEEDLAVHAFNHRDPAPAGEITWGLDAIHAPAAWPTTTGTGVPVCVVDTGIDAGHPEFKRGNQSIVRGQRDFVDGDAVASDPNGHGTHVAGTIAAQRNGTGVAGVAPGVDLYIARVLDAGGSGSISGVINGVNWCVAQGARVLNLSLGSSSTSRTFQKAFDAAYRQGVLVVAASGNDGARRISYPAAYNSVIAVGAVDARLELAGFSNWGKQQELVAPGVSVLSAVPAGTGRSSTVTVRGTGYASNPLEYSSTGNASGTLVDCGLAGNTNSCGAVPTGNWIAYIDRGSFTFADKVRNVMAQGARAAIIANNDSANPDDPGAFTLGGPGNWIPAVSVSYRSGQAIRGAALGESSVAVATSNYATYSGTSMAAPHVAGAAALVWAANPGLSNAKVRSILQDTALDLGAAGRDEKYGHGLVQAHAAVQRAGRTR